MNVFTIFYKLLNITGLMSVYYVTNENSFKIKYQIYHYIYFVIIQVSLILSIIVLSLNKEKYFFGAFNKTGNYFSFISVLLSHIVHVLLNTWWLIQQKRHLNILETLRKWSKFYEQTHPKSIIWYHRTGLIMLIVIPVIYLQNVLVFCHITLGAQVNIFYFPWFTYTICCITTILVLSIYIDIVLIISNCFKNISFLIDTHFVQTNVTITKRDLKKLQKLLIFCNDIVYIAREEISSIYGFAILICTFFIMMESVLDVYIVAISNIHLGIDLINPLHSLAWMLPMFIFLIVGFLMNDTNEEVNIFLID